jgi:exopolyphosphatase / guanosine-5'-triphosphate,3'-diphosphate pyrophosphatase
LAIDLAAPIHLAAIDAGSNALRLVIARATSTDRLTQLETERVAVRLGHQAFTRHQISGETIARAARAFRHFRRVMHHYHVTVYRAVATAAAREARNRQALVDRIRRKSGIALEVISGEHEARLVTNAVQNALGGVISPRLILDLGGGSLELNLLRGGTVERRIALPLGTVRLMETYGLGGAIDEEAAEKLRLHVLALLRSALPSPPNLSGAVAVACGGNAEALAMIAAGPRIKGIPTINLRLLRDRTWQILPLDVLQRMSVFRVRRDRAEVMGIAALVLNTLGNWLSLRSLVVPGVGVREGVLLDLVAAQYSPDWASNDEKNRAELLLAGVRWFARRLDYDGKHAEQVSALALSLFDQLRPLHGMGPDLRLVLELGSLLHDVGHFVSRKAHHRHGDYLVRNAEIPGLRGWRRAMVASLVRYHNSKSEPRVGHKPYMALDSSRRQQLRQLTALLRIAEKLESDHRQGVLRVEVDVDEGAALFRIHTQNGTRLDLAGVARKAAMFEREFQLKAVFKRVQSKSKVA